MSQVAWDSDLEVAIRFFRRRWWDDVRDLVAATGDRLAFDDLDLDTDLAELRGAIGVEKLARLSLRLLAGDRPEEAQDPEVRALDADLAPARAFLRLLGVNLAFALRTEPLLEALVASGRPPRLEPATLGALLARARPARGARRLLGSLAAGREEALAAVKPSARAGDWRCVHAHASPEAIGEALARLLAKQGLVPARWTERKARAPLVRYAVVRPRGGWSTLLAPGGIDRAFAVALAAATPSLARVVWCERTGEAGRYAILEGSRVVDDDARLHARVPDATLDDVTGTLRALGITAHDLAAPGPEVPLVFETLAPSLESSVRLKRAVGFAFLPRDEAQRVDREVGKQLYKDREARKRKKR